MTREFNRNLDVDPESWQPAFTRVAVFSLLLLTAILSLRALSGLSAHNWARNVAAGPTLHDLQTAAVISLVLSALPSFWKARCRGFRRAYQEIDYSRILLLLGIALGVLSAILSLRAISVAAYIPALDFVGGLLLPMASGFTLIMFPDIDRNRMRSALKLLAVCCLLVVVGLKFASQLPVVHATPKGTTETPQHRHISYAPVMA